MTVLYRLLAKEPVMLAAFVEAVATFLVIDTDWSEVRQTGLLGVVTAFNAWWVRVLSTPTATASADADAAHALGKAQTEEVIRALATPVPPAKRAAAKKR